VIEAHLLVDPAVVGVVGRQLPARVGLDERQPVRVVAVDLVRRREDEDGVRRVLAGGLEQDHRPVRVDREVRHRLPRGPVVRRLRGGVDHQVEAEPLEQVTHGLRVADVGLDVRVARVALLQEALVPVGRRVDAEEVLAGVVVDPDHVEAELGEEAHAFRADQARRTCHEGSRHRRRENRSRS
jgi:hypothetical protein